MEKVVITGMGVISPIGKTVAEFAENLFAGRHGIATIDHFDASDLAVRVNAPVKDYDAQEYFSERDAHRMDTYSQYGMIAAREAVHESGILGDVDPYRLGVYLTTSFGGTGTLLGEYATMERQGPGKVSPLTVPKFLGNLLSGLVAIDTGARGPAAAHGAACAASAVSIGEGMRAIRHGYVDAVICGGGEAATQKLIVSGFQNVRALTTEADPDRACLPFDRQRSGFVMGEGAGALVLESESHAKARGATILAEVSGYGLTDDAAHMTAPAQHGESVDRAIADAIADAGSRDETLYVNAHGTSTVKNDRLESAAIARMLGGKAVVSSTKSMTGHLLGAAGAVEAVASVLALREQRVPPTVGTTELDEDIQVDVVHGGSRSAEFSRAVSLSLGFGGHNACLVLDHAGE
ncbi:beta-ketoacyl-[acyl-carrier-protein] synthase family protein [Myceligenerans xiligouense]|uniref:3-oxoacyl-[acyl-carrier-protein] synthase II n=1 Tax=Myceligenerans xiligouense TaxID=253184 RepID=A0A3N4YUL1_9MICO|nr:beta-ketoacyl-ACP synthase II [Myceligenerans xiligouense]RPF22270.1 3-oxoacyl-[acyl-carrier-protein] synthase II [Myceligenerans xiligouense]